MPGRSTPMIRRSCRSAMSRASTGICRRAPGVPCSQKTGRPFGVPNEAKPSRRPSLTAIVPSSWGRAMATFSFMCTVCPNGRTRGALLPGGQGVGRVTRRPSRPG